MLDLAAGNGLQVIVLSCTPADYHALGATTVELFRPAVVQVSAQTNATPAPVVPTFEATGPAPSADEMVAFLRARAFP